MITINAYPEDVALAAAKDAFTAAEAAVEAASAAVDRARDAYAASEASRGDVHTAKLTLSRQIEVAEQARAAVRHAEKAADTARAARRSRAAIELGEKAARLDALASQNTEAIRRLLLRTLGDLDAMDRTAQAIDGEAVMLADEANVVGVRVRATRPFIPSSVRRDWETLLIGAQRLLRQLPQESPR